MNPSSLPFLLSRRGGVGHHLHVLDHGPMTRHDKLITQTRKWVATAFFEPLLEQARKDPFRSTLFDGGSGGQAFGAMYDERLAERITSDASDTLVQSIVNKIENHGGGAHFQAGMKAEQGRAERWRARRAAANSHLFHGDNHVPPYI